jgi:hypothetical protein
MTTEDILEVPGSAQVTEIRKLESEIRKELGLLQLRLKLDESSQKQPKRSVTQGVLSLGFREHVTLFLVVFVLLFTVSPVFRGLLVTAYKHYVLGVDLATALKL